VSPAAGGDRRLVRAGILLGSAAIALAVSAAGRRAERSARRGLVDWDSVEAIAVGRLRRAPGALTPGEMAIADEAYAAAMRVVAPALEAHLGVALPGIVERAGAVDRAGWVHANTLAFAQLLGRLEGDVLGQLLPAGVGGSRATIIAANRWLTTRQVAYMLAFMGQRVLGQYDIALLAAEEDAPGRLLFVEENIRQTAKTLDVPLGPFRTWIALHEATHAFEFEAHPWLRPYLASRLEAQLTAFSRNASGAGRDALRALAGSMRGEGGSWIERMMPEESRRAFRETQAVMSLLEGFSDHVMDEVGRSIVPGHATISGRFHQRRARKSALERAILRITGLEMKMEQYRRGEAFVAAIASVSGQEGVQRLWDGPESMPRDGEIEDPTRWMRRVLGVAPGAAA
jgi:coenzyme F420 biosynthesis associated uncharacterized protein